jgi:hypothetical protein
MTVQIALLAQVPGHGSMHLFLLQAMFLLQSPFSTHSGLQPILGSPKYSGRQLQSPLSQCVFGPQGEGLQGSLSTSTMKKIIRNFEKKFDEKLMFRSTYD